MGAWWLAECFEVGVVAPGETREEARRNLGAALRDYLADAEAGRVALIGPAPWYGLHMLVWRLHWILEGRPGAQI